MGRRHSGKQVAVIDNQLGRVAGKVAVSFTNLMELRFVATFANAGVGLREIRKIMDEVRETLEHPHPFATHTVFKTDGKKIVAEIAKRNGVSIYDLRTKNYEIHLCATPSEANTFMFSRPGFVRFLGRRWRRMRTNRPPSAVRNVT